MAASDSDVIERVPRRAERDVAEARAWAAQARADAIAIREERDRLERVRHEEHAASANASRELAAAKRTLIAELESCDDSVFRRLTSEDIAELLAILQEE